MSKLLGAIMAAVLLVASGAALACSMHQSVSADGNQSVAAASGGQTTTPPAAKSTAAKTGG